MDNLAQARAAVGTNAAGGKASGGFRGTLWEREALSEDFGAGAVGARLLVAAMTLASPASAQIYRPKADLSSKTGVLARNASPGL